MRILRRSLYRSTRSCILFLVSYPSVESKCSIQSQLLCFSWEAGVFPFLFFFFFLFFSVLLSPSYLPHAHGLFILFVPCPNYQHKHGTDSALQKSEEESLRVEALVVLANSRQNEAYAPYDHDEGCHALDRKPLGEHDGWIRPGDEAYVEYGRGEGVAIADIQFEVFQEAEECLLVQLDKYVSIVYVSIVNGS